MNYYLSLFLTCGVFGHLFAQEQHVEDSLSLAAGSIETTPKSNNTCWIASGILITGGSILALNKHADEFFFTNLEVWETRNKHFSKYDHNCDDYLQHVPSLAAFSLSLLGVKGKNTLPNQVALYIKSEVVMAVTVVSLKRMIGERRPDGYKKNSFPSGHTAQAFVAASFLAMEYGGRSAWYSVGAYTLASTVGVMRILNNRHWASDVLVGAGIGILSTKIIYATHQFKWDKKKPALALSPTFDNGSTGLYCSLKF